MRGGQETIAVLMAALLTVSIIGMVAVLGAGSAGAIHPDDAEDMSEHANFTINPPFKTDHYPGDQNEENGSMEYFSAGEDAFHENDASEGVYIDYIIVHAEYQGENWIDYSACDVDNTEAFGIDRGNNNSGTQTDEDLVERQKEATFRDDGIVVEFFDWDDLNEDPPYLAPEDAIVASQGQGSAGGPCLTMTDQPGWYHMKGFLNGTVADNGQGEEPSDDAKEVSIEVNSTYIYVCECDSEEEARDELGPPPNEDGGDGDDGGEQDDGEATETPEQEDGQEQTEEQQDGNETEQDDGQQQDGEETEQQDDGQQQDGDQPVEPEDETPTEEDEMPGFGAAVALVALLTAALLAHRRG